MQKYQKQKRRKGTSTLAKDAPGAQAATASNLNTGTGGGATTGGAGSALNITKKYNL